MVTKSRIRRRPDELRAQILATAELMFREKGLAGTTAEEIAAEAGVARSVLYRHFDGKADLFRESVLLPFVEFMRDYGKTWREQRDAPWDELRLGSAMVGIFYDSCTAHRDALLAAGSHAALDPESRDGIRAAIDDFFVEMMVIAGDEADRRTWISQDDLEFTIRLFLASIAGAAVLESLFLPDGAGARTRDEVVDRLTRLLVYGLALAPASSSADGPQADRDPGVSGPP